MKFYYPNEFLNLLKTQKNIVIMGLSLRVMDILNRFDLSKNVVAVLDNDPKKQSKKFKNIKIISQQQLKKSHKIVIFLCPYMQDFAKQILDLKFDIFAIEYDKSCFERFFGDKFKFHLETMDYRAKFEKNNPQFSMATAIFDAIAWYNVPILTTSTKHNNQWYFAPRKAGKYDFLISYHSIGKKAANILRYKEGYFHDIMFFDDIGFSGFSSNIDSKKVNLINQNEANKYFDKIYQTYTVKNLSKYEQTAPQKLNLPKKYLFLAMQTTDDAVMQLSYFEPIDLVKKLVKFTQQNGLNLVIKRHPRCHDKNVDKLFSKISSLKHVFITTASIHQLIKNASAVFTINSGVGFEALMHLKPVVLFGKADYESCCVVCKDIAKLSIPSELNDNQKLYIKKFITYFMQNLNANINDKDKIARIIDIKLKDYLEKIFKQDYLKDIK
ncbi:capsular polysaccharide export protein, LipB/KpsS family [Campylobacter sputorum]|uniref:capsular polysaccharide export protein, LipB/KpsS family n=1 Tax=Campylobacter sputorum TaxID=206 RepID=UPI001E49E40D|nr:hypothetical protein [Campylobacter sputorum]